MLTLLTALLLTADPTPREACIAKARETRLTCEKDAIAPFIKSGPKSQHRFCVALSAVRHDCPLSLPERLTFCAQDAQIATLECLAF